MVIANFTTKSGMKVILEGESKEVADTIGEFETKEKKAEERRSFFGRMMEKGSGEHGVITKKMANHKLSLTNFLLKFIDEGFFNQKRRIGEVMKKFGDEEIYPPTSTIHPLLGRMVLKDKLKREKNEDGIWEYSKV